MDTNVLIALIKAISIIIAAAVPGLIAAWIAGKLFKTRSYKKLLKEHVETLKDIEYLLEVERLHCREHIETTGHSLRNTIRANVNNETHLVWSGNNTQKRVYLRRKKRNEELSEIK